MPDESGQPYTQTPDQRLDHQRERTVVIKGWTMDPSANDAYRPNNTEYDDDEDSEHEISLSDLENSLKEDVSVYR